MDKTVVLTNVSFWFLNILKYISTSIVYDDSSFTFEWTISLNIGSRECGLQNWLVHVGRSHGDTFVNQTLFAVCKAVEENLSSVLNEQSDHFSYSSHVGNGVFTL